MISLNGQPIIPTIFPDKTSQVWKLPENSIENTFAHYIFWEFEEEAELIWLAQLVDLLRVNTPKANLHLHMPYFPYARQDKTVANNATFAKRTFIKLLDTLNFTTISSLDVHSNAYEQHLDGFENHKPMDEIRRAIRNVGPTVLVFPDEGAEQRYKEFGFSFHTISAMKTRDQQTGEITGLVLGDVIDKDDRVLIIDDICDGGRTFVELAKLMPQAKSIALYTTHGIYSKGLVPLFDAGISRIFNRDGEITEL